MNDEFNKWLSKADIEFEYAFTAVMERDLNAALEMAFKAGSESKEAELERKLGIAVDALSDIASSTYGYSGAQLCSEAQRALSEIKKEGEL
jgi:hypothetical protein